MKVALRQTADYMAFDITGDAMRTLFCIFDGAGDSDL
jgi:hypothetical protein